MIDSEKAEAIACLLENRAFPGEEAAIVASMDENDRLIVRDVAPIKAHRLFCPPGGCSCIPIVTTPPAGWVRIYAQKDDLTASRLANAWRNLGHDLCFLAARKADLWHVYRKARHAALVAAGVDLSKAFADIMPDPAELDLSAYFAPDERRARIPLGLALEGRDLRARGEGVWTVSRNEKGERWAEMDTCVKPALGRIEWAR